MGVFAINAPMAGKSYLIRDVPEDIRLWVEEKCAEYHVTQQEFLMRILQESRDANPTAALDLPAARRRMEQESFTFIDLFAGIGGLRLGVEKAGGRCLFSCEWDSNSQKTYKAWFGENPHGDINKIEPKDIPDHDMLVAGFPCQPFSLAGVSKKKSLGRPHGFEDVKQGNLFFVLADIVAKKRPPMLLLENVKNLRSHDKGNTWRVIKSTLESLNYSIHDKLIDAAAYVPQHRERIFIVGFDKDVFGENPDFTHPEPPKAKPKLRDILDAKVDAKYTLSDKLWSYLQSHAEKHRAKGNGFGFGLSNLDGVSRTLSARYHKDGSEILIPQKGRNPRRLTPREAQRLMGFPDDLPIVVSDTQAYRQFGNAVVPLVSEAVAKQMAKTWSTFNAKKKSQ